MDSSNASTKEIKNPRVIFKNLKSDYFLVKIFDNLLRKRSLEIVKFNKYMRERMNMSIKDYKEYAQKFIDNGFDDLNLLLFQTESGIAISNQNLKDIGISPYGERAKILIHLEERAGLIPYILEKEKIYSSEHYSNNKNNSLINFLDSINFRQYEKNFNDNGYYSSELLFTQMFTRQPIDENILKEDFNIGKKGHRLFLYNSLIKESKEYKKKLRKRGNTAMIYDEASLKACEPCIIY